MNKRLIQRAMEKLVDQQPTKGTLPLSVPTLSTDDGSFSLPSSAEADELQAARIRAEIARADALRQTRAQQRQEGKAGDMPAGSSFPDLPGQSRHEPEIRWQGPAAQGTGSNPEEQAAGHAATAAPFAAAQPETGNATAMPASNRPIAVLDLPNLQERGFLVPDDKTAKIHQEFRLIKRRLLDNAFGRLRPVVKNGRMIMVTSSLPSEGKTFCSINLAISIAIGGEHPVLLVDADIARPSISNTLALDLPDNRGVADYLDTPTIPLADMLLNTSIPGLSVLQAGHLENRPVDLLASTNMARLVDELGRALPRHVIVFDSPPLLPVTETRSLSALVGQVVLVVAAGETPRNAVNEALLQLENCEAVGLLMNKASAQPKTPAYYGY